jgi:crotonobetainyl-CoA:carnitine CoA-transferase CaiB-like acyl-CoA transferase
VIDLTRYLPGPYSTMLLGDLGADVVKVEEPPFGDPTRAVAPAVPGGEDSALHAALNRNKRSVLVDLRQPEGAALVRRLAAAADVLVEGFRPGVLDRRGLGAAVLCAENPRLVYCSLSGFPRRGSRADSAGHDIDYLARSGFLGTNLDRQGHPVLPLGHVADMAGALVAVIGVLSALLARQRTGHGQVVDTSLQEAALSLLTASAARALSGASELGELAGENACYNVYPCRDGRHVAVGALEPRFWERLCEELGLEDRSHRQWESAERRQELVAAMARAFSERDREEWLARFAEQEACVEPVLDLEGALADAERSGLLWEGAEAAAGQRTLRPPLHLSETPPSWRRPAPTPGQHTDEVLREVGCSEEDLLRMRELKVVA